MKEFCQYSWLPVILLFLFLSHITWLAISSSDSVGYKMLQNVNCMEMSGIELHGKLQYVNILHVCFLIFVLNCCCCKSPKLIISVDMVFVQYFVINLYPTMWWVKVGEIKSCLRCKKGKMQLIMVASSNLML